MENPKSKTPRAELEKIKKSGASPVRAENISDGAKLTHTLPILNASFSKSPSEKVNIDIEKDSVLQSDGEAICVTRGNLNQVKDSVFIGKSGALKDRKQSFRSGQEQNKAIKTQGKRSGRQYKGGIGFSGIIARIGVCLSAFILFAVAALYSIAFCITHGPSKTARNTFILNAMGHELTCFLPNMLLSEKTVDDIVRESRKKTVEEYSLKDYLENHKSKNPSAYSIQSDLSSDDTDSILYKSLEGTAYTAHIIVIKDPSLIYAAVAGDFNSAEGKMTVFECAERFRCLCAVNATEASVEVLGLTYSQGSAVNVSADSSSFVGFDINNSLIVSENMTADTAKELQIRDGVSIEPENILISSSDETVKINYYYNDTASLQRSAIGQRADGSVIFIATDGVSFGCAGAKKNDIINLMVDLGAVNAVMLDNTSSASMYCRDFPDKYGVDSSMLDEYRKKGMVNRLPTFSKPKSAPVYFVVRGS